MLRYSLWMVVCFLKYTDFSVSAEPTLSVVKTNKEYLCTLTNDTEDSAILWGYQNQEEQARSNTIFCDILSKSQCQLHSINLWSIQEHMDSLPILDHRWEGIPSAKIVYSPPKLVYTPQEKNFRMSFSLKAMEVHILLCDREYKNSYGNCYWIGINVNKGTGSYLRQCEEKQIPTTNTKYAMPPCSTSGISNKERKNLLNANKWKHFTVSKKNNGVTLWSYEHKENILDLQARSNPYDVTHVYVRIEGNDDSYMKLHKVWTLHSTEPAVANIALSPSVSSCLSLYVKVCNSCTFKILTSDVNSTIEEKVVNSISEEWQRIVLRNRLRKRITNISLRAETTGNTGSNSLFWYLSSTIQKCDEDDIPLKRGDKGCCFALKYKQLKVCARDFEQYEFEDTDFECRSNAIGRNCLPCKAFGNSHCKETKICYTTPKNRTLCSCAPGYETKRDCEVICSTGTYGHNCRKHCGKCIGKTCDHITGKCICEENFNGPTCDQPVLPIVKKAPTKKGNDEYRRIIINLNLEYDGLKAAKYYQVQYKKQQDHSWLNSTMRVVLVNETEYEIDGLIPNTDYTVRVLLYASGKEAYDGDYVPILYTKTICLDPSQKDLNQSAAGTSITMTIQNEREEFCQPLNQFKLCLRLYPQEHCRILQKLVIFTSLEYYTNYTIDLRKGNGRIDTWTIQTAEGPPGRVRSIRVGKITNTTAELAWEEPWKRNGIIRRYRVEYFRVESRACPSGTSIESKRNEVDDVTEKSIKIDSLAPYSKYQINVWAFTTQKGDGERLEFNTTQTENPTEREFPTPSFTHSTEFPSVQFEWNCTILEGPVNFDGTLTCKSSWCFNETAEKYTPSYTQPRESFRFASIGYTDYELTILISRSGNQISKTISLLTPPTAPGTVRNITVYTKNATSVSLRWLPPYPPKGKIDYYTIKYFDRGYKYAIVDRTSKCKIWQEQICHTFPVSSSDVYINVWAKNIDVLQNGTESHRFKTLAKEEVSLPAKILSLKWDEEYNLSVRWQHPDQTNGQLRQFLIVVNGNMLATYEISDEKLYYEHKVNIENENLTNRKLNVEVKARNSVGDSLSLETSSIYSPPKQPKLAMELRSEDVTNHTFQVVIPKILDVEGDTSNLYIVVSNTNDKQIIERKEVHPLEHKLLQKINVAADHSWIVGKFDLSNMTNREGFSFEVGDDRESLLEMDGKWTLRNRKLMPGITYKVFVVLNNTYMGFSRVMAYTIDVKTVPPKRPEGLQYLLILLLIPVILCILCGIFIIRRNREKVASSIYVSLQQLGLSRNHSDVPLRPLIRENNTPTPQSSVATPVVAVTKKKEEHTMAKETKYTKPVNITDLNQYIKESIENGEFEKQHGVFQRGQTKPWIYGTKQQNKSKNRYSNLAAYDHTRVKLEIINKDPYSDYINANYIDGYKTKNAYIATQGPKASTLNDFWRMIWQEKVEYIIMIANIVEAGKKKVEKYWPEINEVREFNNIKVKYVSVDVMANYEIRHFIVSRDDQERKIQQLHFLTWPDHGVPLYAESLSPFLKKMLTISHGKVPVVVHCSAGVGRTGSLILCDICLRMAARERQIDAFYYLSMIREQRVNMVDNVEQYKLVHLVLLQCLVAPDTGILCDENMEKNIEIVTSTKIDEEMNYLDESAWQDEAMRTTSVNVDLPIIRSKNRFSNMLPDSTTRVSLTPYPSSDASSSYINAVCVDAFTMPSKFIVTQNPLSSTVGDFWRLIEEKEITMIICLNDLDLQEKTTCKFYPTSNGHSMKPVPYLEITCNRREVSPHFKTYSITMNTVGCKIDDVHITILHFNNWNSNTLHPEKPISLLMAYEEMNRLGRTSDTIAITCHDGATACGLYVAMCFVIDKIKMEQICDVCLAVRTVRHGRKEFVRKPEQYAFLYNCALEYVQQFSMYSNFSSGK